MGNQPGGPASENLALLYQGILTAIVRLQSGKQRLGDANSLQRLMENLFKEIEKEAIKAGYSKSDVDETNVAVVALLDETVQRLDDPGRAQWSPLETKMFPQNRIGQSVFERLQAVRGRRESANLGDLLEVYSLCFLLGYEGQYAGPQRRPELEQLMEGLRQQIDKIRGPRPALSPEGALPRTAAPPPPAPLKPPATWKILGAASLAAACLSWIALRLLLQASAQGIVHDMILP